MMTIVLIGPQGCGKTRTAARIKAMLELNSGIRVHVGDPERTLRGAKMACKIKAADVLVWEEQQ